MENIPRSKFQRPDRKEERKNILNIKGKTLKCRVSNTQEVLGKHHIAVPGAHREAVPGNGKAGLSTTAVGLT